MTHKWSRMATYPKLGGSQLCLHEERPCADTPYSMRVYVPSLNHPYPSSNEARNLRPKGETGFVAILGERAKIHRKVVTRNIVSPYHKRERLLGFCMDANRSFASPFATGVGVQSLMKTFLTPQSWKHTIYGKKCIYRRYWHAYIYGSLRNKNMSEYFSSRPIVSAFKYAHYGWIVLAHPCH